MPLFQPRLQRWEEHFFVEKGTGALLGLTPVGRATVDTLHLSDDPDALTVRSYWVLAGWHPPKE